MTSTADPILSGVQRTGSEYFARGGYAELYKGQRTRKPDDILAVAIKLIRRRNCNDELTSEKARKRFLLEAHLWTQLNHSNIAPLYGLIFEQNLPGLVMPFYKNGDLIHYLQKHPQAKKLTLITEFTAALEYLHGLKPNPVVHGDVKASNILIDDNGHACLADFGLARMLSVTGYTTSSAKGTGRWMSPELLDADVPSPTMASDVWAVGMTILEVFTGQFPFPDIPNDTRVILELGRGRLPRQPREINDIMWVLIGRCWATEPNQRPAVTTLSLILNAIASEHVQTPQCVHTRMDEIHGR